MTGVALFLGVIGTIGIAINWARKKSSKWPGILLLIAFGAGVVAFVKYFHHSVEIMLVSVCGAFLLGYFTAIENERDDAQEAVGEVDTDDLSLQFQRTPSEEKQYKNIDENDGMDNLKEKLIDATQEKAQELKRKDENSKGPTNAHVSLQMAKKLEECGWDGQADFFFVEGGDGYRPVYHKNLDQKLSGGEKIIPAPITENLFFGIDIDTFSVSKDSDGSITAFINNQNATGKRLPDALANWWISEVKNDRK